MFEPRHQQQFGVEVAERDRGRRGRALPLLRAPGASETALRQRRSSNQHEIANISAAKILNGSLGPQGTGPDASSSRRRGPGHLQGGAPSTVAAGDPNAPVKRGRGRPRKDASAAPPAAPVKRQRLATGLQLLAWLEQLVGRECLAQLVGSG
ncbi:hypothetical protein Gpo141_00001623 [Globisporangium polare]